MLRNEITVLFDTDIETLYEAISNYEKYMEWRTDLKQIVPGEEPGTFREDLVSKLRIKSECVVMEDIRPRQFRVSFENNRYRGDRSFILRRQENGGTKMHFTETIVIQNPVSDVLSFLYLHIEKRQMQYIRDLKKYLREKDQDGGQIKRAEETNLAHVRGVGR